MDHLFVGQIVHSKSLEELEIYTHGFLVVQDGGVSIINISTHVYNVR